MPSKDETEYDAQFSDEDDFENDHQDINGELKNIEEEIKVPSQKMSQSSVRSRYSGKAQSISGTIPMNSMALSNQI